jgi:clathrin heavy chain
MALKIYQSCNASGKVIGTLAEKGDFNALVAYTGQTGQKLDYMYLLQVWGDGAGVCGFMA